MNNPYNIYFSPTKPMILTTELNNAYQFRKDKKYHWLQKACIFILNKLGAKKIINNEVITRNEVITKYEIKPQKLLDQLIAQKYYIIEQLNMTPKELLIGSKEYAELMHEEDLYRYFNFRIDYKYTNDNGINTDTYSLGLKVTVIPWMQGMILIPWKHNL